MASKTTENSKRRTRKAASIPAPVALEPRQDIGNDNANHNDENKIHEVVSNSKPSAAATAVDISEEEIRRRAYELYLERGATPGDPSQDWLVAEQQVRSRQMQHAR